MFCLDYVIVIIFIMSERREHKNIIQLLSILPFLWKRLFVARFRLTLFYDRSFNLEDEAYSPIVVVLLV